MQRIESILFEKFNDENTWMPFKKMILAVLEE